jgi:carbon monoxide dehydrogenase subunit G
MATVQVEIELDANAAEAWALIGDYGAAADLAPGFVTECRREGDERVVTFASGFVAREKLVTLDADRRRLVYSARGGRADHHNSVMELLGGDTGGGRLRWTTDILPDALAPFVETMMAEGGAAISRRFASRPAEAAA